MLRDPVSLYPIPFHHPLLSRCAESFPNTEKLLREEKEEVCNSFAPPGRGRGETAAQGAECWALWIYHARAGLPATAVQYASL